MHVFYRLSFVLILAAMMSCSEPAPAPLTVTPGIGIGVIGLGDARAEVAASFEMEPTRGNEMVLDSLVRDEWNLPGGQHVTVLYHEDRVLQIRAEGPAISTAEGISTQSTLAEIRRVFPNTAASMMAHDMTSMYFDDIAKGIAFGARTIEEDPAANAEGDVISMFVHEPGREVLAIVHEHGHAGH